MCECCEYIYNINITVKYYNFKSYSAPPPLVLLEITEKVFYKNTCHSPVAWLEAGLLYLRHSSGILHEFLNSPLPD